MRRPREHVGGTIDAAALRLLPPDATAVHRHPERKVARALRTSELQAQCRPRYLPLQHVGISLLARKRSVHRCERTDYATVGFPLTKCAKGPNAASDWLERRRSHQPGRAGYGRDGVSADIRLAPPCPFRVRRLCLRPRQ